MTDALTWAGTFHGIGARLLRDYADQIGLDPAFTIHDREDSADLMNLVRHELGFSKTESRFPTKGTCLAIYSRCVNAELPTRGGARRVLSLVRRLGRRAASSCLRAYVEAKQRQNVLDYDDLLLYWAQMVSEPALAARHRRALRSCARRRVPGHEPAAVLDPAGAEAGRARPHRGRRRRAVDLFVPRRDGAQHPRLPRAVQPAGRDRHARPNYRSTQPILAAANARHRSRR